MYVALRCMRRWLSEPIETSLRAPKKRFGRLFIISMRRSWHQHLPIAMITGTKGKTTTSRMLARILSKAGSKVGLTATDSLVIGGEFLRKHDLSC